MNRMTREEKPMSTNGDASLVAGRKRRRPAVVCTECRRRKIACDRNHPCAQCIQAKATCVFHAPYSSRPSTKPAFPPGIQPADGLTASPSQSIPTFEPPPLTTPLRTPYASTPLTTKGAGESTASAAAERDVPSRSMGVEVNSLKGRVVKSRLYGRSHWMNDVPRFEVIFSATNGVFAEDEGEMADLLRACKDLSRRLKPKKKQSDFSDEALRSHVPARETCNRLIELYFRTFELVFRVLHRQTFLKDVQNFFDNPLDAPSSFVVQLLLVLSIGSCFATEAESIEMNLRATSLSWIYAAQSWLSAVLDKHRMGVPAVQAQCLLILALQTNAVGGDLTWIAVGFLVRLGMTIGLHRDPRNFPEMSVYQAEIRRRLWATTLELAVQSSIAAGMPSLIGYEDYDCEPPANLDDEQISPDADNQDQEPMAHPPDQFSETAALCALMRSMPVRLRIVEALNSIRADLTYDTAIRLAEELHKVCRYNSHLFQSVQRPGSPWATRPTAFAIKILDMLTRRFIISVHAPFIREGDTEVVHSFSRVACLDASLLVCSYRPPRHHDGGAERDYLRFQDYARGIFKSIFLQAYIVIFSELIMQLDEDTSPWTSSLPRTELYQAVADITDISWRRVEAGETNIKQHIYFFAAKAQIEAMREGVPIRQAVMEAGRRSMQDCYVMLKRRVDAQATSKSNSTSHDGGLAAGTDFLGNTWDVGLDAIDEWLLSTWDNNELM